VTADFSMRHTCKKSGIRAASVRYAPHKWRLRPLMDVASEADAHEGKAKPFRLVGASTLAF